MRVRTLYPALVTLGLTLMGCHKQAAPVTTPSTSPGNSGTGTTPTTATSGAGNRTTPNDPSAAAEAERKMALATMGETIHFEYNRFDIRPSDQVILDAKAGLLTKYPSLRIRVSGHADERGSDEYNLVLGNQRALAAKEYLQRKGIDASRIDIVSYGEEHPADPASTEEAWAKNRRDEFEIVAGQEAIGKRM